MNQALHSFLAENMFTQVGDFDKVEILVDSARSHALPMPPTILNAQTKTTTRWETVGCCSDKKSVKTRRGRRMNPEDANGSSYNLNPAKRRVSIGSVETTGVSIATPVENVECQTTAEGPVTCRWEACSRYPLPSRCSKSIGHCHLSAPVRRASFGDGTQLIAALHEIAARQA